MSYGPWGQENKWFLILIFVLLLLLCCFFCLVGGGTPRTPCPTPLPCPTPPICHTPHNHSPPCPTPPPFTSPLYPIPPPPLSMHLHLTLIIFIVFQDGVVWAVVWGMALQEPAPWGYHLASRKGHETVSVQHPCLTWCQGKPVLTSSTHDIVGWIYDTNENLFWKLSITSNVCSVSGCVNVMLVLQAWWSAGLYPAPQDLRTPPQEAPGAQPISSHPALPQCRIRLLRSSGPTLQLCSWCFPPGGAHGVTCQGVPDLQLIMSHPSLLQCSICLLKSSVPHLQLCSWCLPPGGTHAVSHQGAPDLYCLLAPKCFP